MKFILNLVTMKWLDRSFDYKPPEGIYLDILERLEGTPQRIRLKVENHGPQIMTRRRGQAWSAQEHIGHLLTLESLWIARLDDFALGHETLRPWNGTNADTDQALFNNQSLHQLLNDFEGVRSGMVRWMRTLEPKASEWKARHPRLGHEVRLIDQAWFVAEHDDHHLAAIHSLLNT